MANLPNVPGVPVHWAVVAKRPDGKVKVAENDNAFPDGVGKAAEVHSLLFTAIINLKPFSQFKVNVRDAGGSTIARLEDKKDCMRIGSVSESKLGSVRLEEINQEIKKDIPNYKVIPDRKKGEGNCQDHVYEFVEALGQDPKKLPEKQGKWLGRRELSD